MEPSQQLWAGEVLGCAREDGPPLTAEHRTEEEEARRFSSSRGVGQEWGSHRKQTPRAALGAWHGLSWSPGTMPWPWGVQPDRGDFTGQGQQE
jgi:hypothetical protein